MKKLFLILLVLLGLQTQAQPSLCDSIEISITINTDYFVELEEYEKCAELVKIKNACIDSQTQTDSDLLL